MTFQVKMQVTGLNHYLNLLLAQVFFTLLRIQLPDFSVSGILAQTMPRKKLAKKTLGWKVVREQFIVKS